MAFAQKTPPIRFFVSVEQFNLLMELLYTQITSNDEAIAKKANKLKEKILKYAIPFKNDDDILMVDIRFFSNEAEFIMYTLLNNVNKVELTMNYYEVLTKVRENLKQDKTTDE